MPPARVPSLVALVAGWPLVLLAPAAALANSNLIGTSYVHSSEGAAGSNSVGGGFNLVDVYNMAAAAIDSGAKVNQRTTTASPAQLVVIDANALIDVTAIAGIESVLSFVGVPTSDVAAGGYFTMAGGVSANNIARWNGTTWSALGSGTNWAVAALTTLPNGDLVAGGHFTVVDGVVSAYVARLTTTCPATAVSYGAGCTGSGGPNVLAATSLPWIGSTFRSVATGMPASALALGVFGFSTISIPMPSILPQGVPGCTLLVSPDLLEVHLPASGIVQTQLVIPNTVALAGVVLHQQMVPLELGVTGITALTGTNALTLTIGTF